MGCVAGPTIEKSLSTVAWRVLKGHLVLNFLTQPQYT